MPSVELSKSEFTRRLMERYYDPVFAPHSREIEVRNAARRLLRTVRLMRTGRYPRPDQSVADPRPK